MLIPVPVVPRLSRMVSYKLWQISEILETEVCREAKLSENGGEQLCLNKAPCLSLISNGLYPSPSGTVTSKTFTPSGITGSEGWGGAGTSHSLIILCFPVVTDVGCNKWKKKRRKKWFGEELDGLVVFLSALVCAHTYLPMQKLRRKKRNFWGQCGMRRRDIQPIRPIPAQLHARKISLVLWVKKSGWTSTTSLQFPPYHRPRNHTYIQSRAINNELTKISNIYLHVYLPQQIQNEKYK